MEAWKKKSRSFCRNPANGRELLKVREKWIDVDYYEQISNRCRSPAAWETHQIPAITRNRYGKGAAYYLFCETEKPRTLEGGSWWTLQCKRGVSVVTPQGVIGRKNSGKPVFLCESDGKGAENRVSREWIWGAAGERWKILARCRRLMVNWWFVKEDCMRKRKWKKQRTSQLFTSHSGSWGD